MLTDFQNSFTGRLTGKFATNSYLNIPPRLKYVATLPCEIWMSETGSNLKYALWLNDKTQDSTAKHLSYDGLPHYKFVNHCAGKRILKIREHLVELQAKWLIVSYAPFALRLLSSKMQNSLDKLNNLFITDSNCYWLLLFMLTWVYCQQNTKLL